MEASRSLACSGLLLAAALSACGPTPPDEPPEPAESPAPGPAASSGGERDERVDLHGEWSRWIDTAEVRQSALERWSDVPSLGLGREASRAEIEAIDIDVMPDGTGLPEGRGSVARGRELYRNQCVQCHGEDGRGADYEALVGDPVEGFAFARGDAGPAAVGNYWPYATTLYDYVYRAMPQAAPGSLAPGDVYSLVAYILHLNGLLPEDGALDQVSLPEVEMPARDRFVYDDRRGGAELR